MKKFAKNLIMTLILIAYVAGVIAIMAASFPDVQIALFVGIPVSLIYALVCFFSKKIRSGVTIWFGILSILTCAYWCWLLINSWQ
ncbi:hypothetical protein AGMMS49982_08420 [Bacteroidia bacterium]|nr:hypothetical protein AGMMS49982_08420 [Bacteroidia bacterium]